VELDGSALQELAARGGAFEQSSTCSSMPLADKQALYMFMADYQRSTRRTGSPVMVGVPESLALGAVDNGKLLDLHTECCSC
jgi:hypothetical protein